MSLGNGIEERYNTPLTGKFWIYERVIRPAFYGIYEVNRGAVEVYHLIEGRYELLPANQRGHYPISLLGVELEIWQGHYQNAELPWLRWWDDRGNLLLTGEERAELADERAQLAQERAQLANERAQLAQERADRLAARLRAMGINLDVEI